MERVKQYHYDDYGVFTGASDCFVFKGRLVPSDNSTLLEPPEAPDGKCAIFTGEEWVVVEDRRGEYYNADGSAVSIGDPRSDLSAMATTPRPSGAHVLVGREWAEDEKLKSEALSKGAMDELQSLDGQSIRPLRVVVAAIIEGRAPDAEDEKRLVEIEKRAVAERAKVI